MSLRFFQIFPGTGLALLLSVVTLFIAAHPAFAHTHPVEMIPAADATVQGPAAVTIHFSEAMEPKFSMITVSDAGGHVINKQPSVVSADAKTMTVPLPALAPGVYTVNWVAVAVDTHRSQGEYKFTVK